MYTSSKDKVLLLIWWLKILQEQNVIIALIVFEITQQIGQNFDIFYLLQMMTCDILKS